jgi:hypothetical protein
MGDEIEVGRVGGSSRQRIEVKEVFESARQHANHANTYDAARSTLVGSSQKKRFALHGDSNTGIASPPIA